MQLLDVAKQIRPIIERAVKDLGPDLAGYSVIDLVLDNVDVSVIDAKSALVVAGIDNLLSTRLVRSYSK